MTTTDVALKEWATVCDALASGRQAILLRKGGIQEGPGGFTIVHRRFALLPTRLHEQRDMLKPEFQDQTDGEASPEAFELTHAGEITDIVVVPSREALDRLDRFHVWAAPYLEMRWNYRPERPLYLLIVRAYALALPFTLKNTYEIAGCRSWVPLPTALDVATSAIDGDTFARQRDAIRALMS